MRDYIVHTNRNVWSRAQDLEQGTPKHSSLFRHYFHLQCWASHFTSLCISLPFCEAGIIIPTYNTDDSLACICKVFCRLKKQYNTAAKYYIWVFKSVYDKWLFCPQGFFLLIWGFLFPLDLRKGSSREGKKVDGLKSYRAARCQWNIAGEGKSRVWKVCRQLGAKSQFQGQRVKLKHCRSLMWTRHL